MENNGSVIVDAVTDSDQAVWNAYGGETLKMAEKCEPIWNEKEREKMEEEEAQAHEQFSTDVVTDSDQAVWNAYAEETLKMAAKCEQIWREKMEREKMEREEEEEEAHAADHRHEQLGFTDAAPVSSRFWSQRWRIRDVFHRLITS